ncbi:UDP-2,3-diacylglucosamine diphosphatase [Leucothrix arctica]|uniref:UDP-2,3-diacylglucosamine hydrolase n=1 Tax=Leucothrix arctica TaxID=1481894 RepID=A0A317CNF3_9GAMM|nr:UDP-2,3-diacylglucosamine diphosphatase [Leucothrix arctica]PWQ99731.1 UDP-2,3-diacylglucosamine hydrolase [Leucothrix arctica]
MTGNPKHHYRSIFISDTHLGSRGCKSALLLDFLEQHDCQNLYMVGDIFDGWRLRKRWFWQPDYDDIIQNVLARAQRGAKVVYLSGNHDGFTRNFTGHSMSKIELADECIHITADNKKMLVLHGDRFDGVVKFPAWLTKLGDAVYENLVIVNRYYNLLRTRMGYPYWSLSGYIKENTKSAVQYIAAYEEACAKEARQRNFDGVICGHIHHAAIREIDGIMYYNDGDWVESCTALAEDYDGQFHLINWAEHKRKLSTKTRQDKQNDTVTA